MKALEGKNIHRVLRDLQDFSEESHRLLQKVGMPANKLYVDNDDLQKLMVVAGQMQAARDLIMQLIGRGIL